MNFAKPKIYDEDGNEIIPPEGASGFVVGEEGKFAWTTNEDLNITFIYTPEPYTKPIAENIECGYKFAAIPKILNDSWYIRKPKKRVRMKTRRIRNEKDSSFSF